MKRDLRVFALIFFLLIHITGCSVTRFVETRIGYGVKKANRTDLDLDFQFNFDETARSFIVTLLIDNFYIGPSQVNSPVVIGNFRCVPPLGTEFLFVAARTEEFPEIETRQEDGYRFLVSQDAETATQSVRSFPTRGLIPEESSEQQVIDPRSDDDEEQPRFQQSEAQLMLTIMKE